MNPVVHPGESPVGRYRRELRDLMLAGLDAREIPASPPPTRDPALRRDCIRVAEHVSDSYLAAAAPPDPRAVWEEVADDILACLERGRWDRLRPTPWAVRVRYAWWFELTWLGRIWYRLRGEARFFLAWSAAVAATATLGSSAWLSALSAATASSVARAWEWIIAHKPDSLPQFDPDAARPERGRQVPLIRDIFGKPFRPVAVDPRWRTSTVTALAEAVYAERAFDRLPILADALKDAGCDSADVLTHCRGDGPHVRGCWVIDLVLGKG